MRWVLLLDFDGTMTPIDVGPLILSQFTGDRWLPVNEGWERGELTTPERAERQWTMVTADEAAVQALLDQVHAGLRTLVDIGGGPDPGPGTKGEMS